MIYLKLRCGKEAPLNGLYNWIKILSQLLARSETLLSMISLLMKTLLKRQHLLELAIPVRYRDHYL